MMRLPDIAGLRQLRGSNHHRRPGARGLSCWRPNPFSSGERAAPTYLWATAAIPLVRPPAFWISAFLARGCRGSSPWPSFPHVFVVSTAHEAISARFPAQPPRVRDAPSINLSTAGSKATPRDVDGPKAATSARSLSGMNLEVVSGHLAALAVRYQFEVSFLAFAQVTQSGALHGTDMNERIRPTLIWCDEAEALL